MLGHHLHPHQHRAQALARRRGLPILCKDRRLGGVERPVGKPRGKGRIGHEFGMAFPFQQMPAQRRRIMRRPRLRFRRAVARYQIDQMVAVPRPVPVRGIHGFLEGQKHRMAGHIDAGERARMQFVHQGKALRVFGNRRHGRSPLPRYSVSRRKGPAHSLHTGACEAAVAEKPRLAVVLPAIPARFALCIPNPPEMQANRPPRRHKPSSRPRHPSLSPPAD